MRNDRSMLEGFPARHCNYLRQCYWNWRVRALCRKLDIALGRDVWCHGLPILSVAPGSRIAIGDGAVLCSVPEKTALGVNHPVILRTLTGDAEILIGSHCAMSGVAVCAARSVRIGEGTLLGANALIFDTDFHPVRAEGRRFNADWRDIGVAPVRIERNVFIGAGAMICKGVTVGANSVVAAGSVVVEDVPPDTIVGGNPARVIGAVPA